MRLITRLGRSISPPYRLNTIILLSTSTVVVMLAGLYSLLAYERLGRETMASAKRWSDSVAQLVASSNTSAFILNDHAAVESNLKQVALLPGIESLAIFRGDGRLLAEVQRDGDLLRSTVGGTERMTQPPPVPQPRAGDVQNNAYVSWAALELGQDQRLGWVRVRFSLAQRSQELERLWHQSLLGITTIVSLVLASLYVILGWVLGPIRVLSRFAQKLPQQLGSEVAISSTCQEANQLSVALNQASRSMVEQIASVQAIVNTAADAIIGMDAHGRVVTANPAATSIFGRMEEELRGQTLERCVPGLSAAVLRELFGNNQDSDGRPRRIVRHDFFGTRSDGALFPVEVSLGEVARHDRLRYTCIVRDVTDERAAQETTELYERVLASSHNGVFITNAKVQSQPIVYINQALQKVIGLPPHQVLGRSLELFRSDQPDDPGLLEIARAIQEQRTTNVTLKRKLEHDRDLIAEVSLSPVLAAQGTVTHYVGIVSDVTARVQAEQANAERSAQLDAIFSLSPDGFVLFDAHDNMLFANPAFERMTGLYWQRDGAPITLSDFERFMGDLCHREHPLPSILAWGDDTEPWRARLVLARPQHRVLQAQSRRNMAGRRETILYFRDVTHEDEVDRMKSEFLASAAHELRTPMVSIFGFTELLLKRKFNEERQADMLQTIHRQSGLLVKMINELLDLARIESRRGLDLVIGEHRLEELVDQSVKGLMLKDTDRQVGRGAIPDVCVLIDPEKMQLAVNNLLSNAFKYSPQGGEVRLDVQLQQMEQTTFAVLAISDQGLGMKPEQVERAFERFYRADTTGNIPGTGLGLSLVKEIAELHNGRVDIDSAFGVGTTVRLWIPCSDTQRLPHTALLASGMTA